MTALRKLRVVETDETERAQIAAEKRAEEERRWAQVHIAADRRKPFAWLGR